jgi:hypothetical protein
MLYIYSYNTYLWVYWTQQAAAGSVAAEYLIYDIYMDAPLSDT